MKIRIDLKILIFFVLFYLTDQIEIYLIIMAFCVVHELGHMLMGFILGLKLERLTVILCGLTISFKANVDDLNVKIKNGNLLELKKIFVAIAGPLVSLTLAIVYLYFEPIYISKQDAIYSNILILLFNLIPLYPLDGGRILKGILHMQYGNRQAKYIINKVSNITMIILTIMSSIAVYYFKNIAIFLICIFLWMITVQENKKFRTNRRMYEILDKN